MAGDKFSNSSGPSSMVKCKSSNEFGICYSDVDKAIDEIVDLSINSTKEIDWDIFLKPSWERGVSDKSYSWEKSDSALKKWKKKYILGTGMSDSGLCVKSLKKRMSNLPADADSDINFVSGQTVDSSDNDDEELEDSDNQSDEEYASDVSEESFDSRKKSNWCRSFFEALDRLPLEQVNNSTRRWHCPACRGLPGAIVWYKGMQSLITHAKAKSSKRVNLHRDFSDLLEEELQIRGASVILPGETFGKWKALLEKTFNYEIVWPPMVVVMNTQLEEDENKKWIGMGNQELLDYFKTYAAVKARNSYGPCGHRGMSVLIFEGSAIGYLEAQLLHKHLVAQGTDREAWETRRIIFCPGGKRQLYGFLASKEDLDIFDHHSNGKSRLKFEMVSYQEMVLQQIKQMSKHSWQLKLLKNEFAKLEEYTRTLEASFLPRDTISHENVEKNQTVERTMTNDEKDKEEIFWEQIANVEQATTEKQRQFKKLLEEKFADVKQTHEDHLDLVKGPTLRNEEANELVDSEFTIMEELKMAREELLREHDRNKVELRCRYLEEAAAIKREFDSELTKVIDKYAASVLESSNQF